MTQRGSGSGSGGAWLPAGLDPARFELSPEVWAPEQRLAAELTAWALWSTGLGAVLWRVGRREGLPALAGAGRVSVAWGLADAAIAGFGFWRGRGARPRDPARARRLALITGANALLDVGYVAGGVRWARVPGRRGQGLATAAQGLFLLYLDTRYSLEFSVTARRAGRTGVGGPLDSGRAPQRRPPTHAGGQGAPANDTAVVRPVS